MPLRRYSTYRGRRLRPDEVLLEKFALSRPGYRYLTKVAPRLDKAVIPRTRGWLSSVGVHKVGLVTTTGARSGQRRTQPLILIPDGDALLAIGSNYGGAGHPSWSANLRAHPECEVSFRGSTTTCRAEQLSGAERAAAWETAVDFYRGYAVYAEMCAPREIRLFRLRPVS